MEWFWWVLIVIGVIAIATLKLKVFGWWLERRKKRETQVLEEE
jgi:integral membrane sensor domain MASE1